VVHRPTCPSNQAVTIEGIVIASQWDVKGKTTAVLLATDSEEEFALRFTGTRDISIEQWLRKHAVVTGRICGEAFKRPCIEVTRIALSQPPKMKAPGIGLRKTTGGTHESTCI
jgi:hypothetical protein